MSIFDVFKKPEQEIELNYSPDSEQEAIVGILYACMDADNDISDTEIHFFTELLGRKKLFSDFNIIELYKKSHYNYLKLGGEKMVKQGSTFIREENKATLFAVTMEILLSDGILTESEKQIAELLVISLKLETELSKKIIEVLLIKNK